MSSSTDRSAADSFEISTRNVVVPAGTLHVLEAGQVNQPLLLFVHGWPQTARAWRPVMQLAAAAGYHAVAPDLPGVGGSQTASTDGSTDALAAVLHDVLRCLPPSEVTLVGHDLGGMAVYSYLRHYDDVARAVIMNTVVPGVAPWNEVLANPYVWHFAFHSIPELPELLVQGKQRQYFDFFFDVLSPKRSGVSDESRDAYAEAYSSDQALKAGFDWYRMLHQGAAVNARATGMIDTPVLYLRGDAEGGDIDVYIDGLSRSGLTDVRGAVVAGAGHFAAEDAPEAVWGHLADFLTKTS